MHSLSVCNLRTYHCSFTGIVIKSSQKGYKRYLRVPTVSKVLSTCRLSSNLLCTSLCQMSLLYILINMLSGLTRSSGRVALRHLASEHLGAKIQSGEHCPVSLSCLLILLHTLFFKLITSKV